ncbi:MAG: DUF389 domain-containing protein [Myxococcales bacterium]|nr:DUF389 domain-containing protein [Myxococcales bacterium]MCB9753355.1 DUF389 domain-containing protein [Myxococcales bacterium]
MSAPNPTPDAIDRQWTRRLQNKLARHVGVSRRDREEIVGKMLKRHRSDAVSYWVELFLSMGIATIALVLNSTGVVIGAMLISPLMGPIVGLGMGLAIGSPFLTLRSLLRVSGSIVGVILMAALLTIMLPFQEVTPEIAMRTSPTALDLMIAGFCALAAAFTTARLHSDTAAAAAGTAIGIALVPPLCVSGFGLGIGQRAVFGGALLLFTANLCAILFISVVLFVALGFTMVDVQRHEDEEVLDTGPIAQAATKIRAFFGSRSGSVLRFLMPALLIITVYVPLRAALEEVAWQVQVRSEITALLAEFAPQGRFVRTNFTVEQRKVVIRLVMMGAPDRARTLENELTARAAAIAGVVPSVEVVAVPDFASLQQVADSITTPLPSPTVEAPPAPDLPDIASRVTGLFQARWPEAAGTLLAWKLELHDGGAALELTHTGAPLGPVAAPLLADKLSEALESPVSVHDLAIETGTWEAGDDVTTWLPRLAHSLEAARSSARLRACVTLGPIVERVRVEPPPAPPPPRGRKKRRRRAPPPVEAPRFEERPEPGGLAADAMLAARPGPNVILTAGKRWAVTLTTDACPTRDADPRAPTKDGESSATESRDAPREPAPRDSSAALATDPSTETLAPSSQWE